MPSARVTESDLWLVLPSLLVGHEAGGEGSREGRACQGDRGGAEGLHACIHRLLGGLEGSEFLDLEWWFTRHETGAFCFWKGVVVGSFVDRSPIEQDLAVKERRRHEA